MPTYKHILVAIDFSPTADEVCQRATDLAGHYQAKLTLLHVVEYLPPLTLGDEISPSPNWVVDEDLLLKNAKESLDKLATKNDLADAEKMVVLGTPKQEILKTAKQGAVDLIVVGSHGRHGVGLLLGSTANGVLHGAPCDVLAVKLGK